MSFGETWSPEAKKVPSGEFLIHVHEVDRSRKQPTYRAFLEPGERIELRYNSRGGRLERYKYDELTLEGEHRLRLGRPCVVLDSLDMESPFEATAFQPRFESRTRTAVFYVSLDTKDRTSCPARRPCQVWAEIRPMSAGRESTGAFYVFTEPEYVPDVPVPVLRFEARDWPPGANLATLRLWFRMDSQGPDSTERVAVDDTTKEGTVLHTDDRASVVFRRADAKRVIVSQETDPHGDIYALQVRMPSAQETRHVYLPNCGRALHAFTRDSRPGVPQVEITPSATFKKHAYRLEYPFEIPIDVD